MCTGKHICDQYRIQRKKGIGWYQSGAKRCSNCEVYLAYDGLRCPCCKTVLRRKSRHENPKKKTKQQMIVVFAK